MKTTANWKAFWLIGILVLVAWLINSWHPRPDHTGLHLERTEPPTYNALYGRTQTIADAATVADAKKRGTSLPRYLDANIPRAPGKRTIAIVAASETHEANAALYEALKGRLAGASVVIADSLFKPQFVADGLFDQVFTEPELVFSKLALTNTLDLLVLGRQAVGYSTNQSLEKVITANLKLDVAIFSVARNERLRTWSFDAAGAGFSPEAARRMAEERLTKKMEGEASIKLPP